MINIPELKPVKSSHIAALGYSVIEEKHKLQRHLFVKLQSGKIYKYTGVHEEIYKRLLRSSSVGVLFNELITSNYDYELIEDA